MISKVLTPVDNVVIAAVRDHPVVQRVVGAGAIQAWDRAIDVRGDLTGQLGRRLRIDIADDEPDWHKDNANVWFTRKYPIWLAAASLDRDQRNAMVEAVWAALELLDAGLKPDETPIAWPTDIYVDSVACGKTDPDFEPAGDSPAALYEISDGFTVTMSGSILRTRWRALVKELGL